MSHPKIPRHSREETGESGEPSAAKTGWVSRLAVLAALGALFAQEGTASGATEAECKSRAAMICARRGKANDDTCINNNTATCMGGAAPTKKDDRAKKERESGDDAKSDTPPRRAPKKRFAEGADYQALCYILGLEGAVDEDGVEAVCGEDQVKEWVDAIKASKEVPISIPTWDKIVKLAIYLALLLGASGTFLGFAIKERRKNKNLDRLRQALEQLPGGHQINWKEQPAVLGQELAVLILNAALMARNAAAAGAGQQPAAPGPGPGPLVP